MVAFKQIAFNGVGWDELANPNIKGLGYRNSKRIQFLFFFSHY